MNHGNIWKHRVRLHSVGDLISKSCCQGVQTFWSGDFSRWNLGMENSLLDFIWFIHIFTLFILQLLHNRFFKFWVCFIFWSFCEYVLSVGWRRTRQPGVQLNSRGSFLLYQAKHRSLCCAFLVFVLILCFLYRFFHFSLFRLFRVFCGDMDWQLVLNLIRDRVSMPSSTLASSMPVWRPNRMTVPLFLVFWCGIWWLLIMWIMQGLEMIFSNGNVHIAVIAPICCLFWPFLLTCPCAQLRGNEPTGATHSFLMQLDRTELIERTWQIWHILACEKCGTDEMSDNSMCKVVKGSCDTPTHPTWLWCSSLTQKGHPMYDADEICRHFLTSVNPHHQKSSDCNDYTLDADSHDLHSFYMFLSLHFKRLPDARKQRSD